MINQNIKVQLTMSSIFRIERTVSEAKVMALVVTRRGCATPSSSMLVIAPCIKPIIDESFYIENNDKVPCEH